MNSLTYISRQFDVLASSKTPPPTPISNAAFLTDPECSSSSRRSSSNQDALKRVKTWSSRAFLFPRSSQQHYTTRSPRRSFSSPADFFSISPLHRPSISTTLDGHIASKEHSQDTLNGLFLISVFMLLWKALCDAWASILGRKADTPSRETSVEAGSETDEKESEDETSDEKTPLIRRLQQPSLMPPASFHPSYSLKVSNALYIASSDELVHPSQIKAEPQALAIPPSSITTSRSSTPTLSTRKASFLTPKTLVLDLDETLIHSTSRPMYSSGSSYNLLGLNTFGRRNNGAGHTVEVVMGGRSTLYHVYKRPFVDFFLRKVSDWYTVVIFTASMREYADPVIDWLDAGRGILEKRLFRDSCTQLPNGAYTKNLAIVEQDLSRVCLIDNSPISYGCNEENGIPIEGWTHDPSDQALLDLIPVLDSLRFTNDVRRVLGIRGFS